MKRQLSFENEKELMLVGKALASEIRIRILKLLDENPLCVNEIAEILQIPPSSAALNVRVLEEAGLIRTELKPGVRGSMKLCIRQNEELVVHLQQAKGKKHEELISMPVGNYVDYKITPTCGMVNDEEYIDGEDHCQAGLVLLRLSGIPVPQCGDSGKPGKAFGDIRGAVFRNRRL